MGFVLSLSGCSYSISGPWKVEGKWSLRVWWYSVRHVLMKEGSLSVPWSLQPLLVSVWFIPSSLGSRRICILTQGRKQPAGRPNISAYHQEVQVPGTTILRTLYQDYPILTSSFCAAHSWESITIRFWLSTAQVPPASWVGWPMESKCAYSWKQRECERH